MPQGLPRRIRLAFLGQALLVAMVLTLGIVLTAGLARSALIDGLLESEAEAFLAEQSSGGAAGESGTAQLRRWFVPDGVEAEDVPESVRSLPEGFSASPLGRGRVLVLRRADGDAYLLLSTEVIDRVIALASLALLLAMLSLMLAINWRTYRRSRNMVLPINRLAEAVAGWHPERWDASVPMSLPYPLEGDGSREVRALSTALYGFAARLTGFVQRERDFTRDASHELRTPLTVIRVAADMMLGDASLPEHARKSLQRIQRAGMDMESLVDAFLILARERGVPPQSEEFDVGEVVEDEVEKARVLLRGKPVELRLEMHVRPTLLGPPGVLGVMLGHLLSNACVFTESGMIEVVLDDDGIGVRDTGIGMSAETLRRVYDPFFRADQFNPHGKGIGLSIVRRLGDRFDWPVELDSEPGRGTLATIRFPVL